MEGQAHEDSGAHARLRPPAGGVSWSRGSRRRRHLWRSSSCFGESPPWLFPLKPLRDDASMRWCECTKRLRVAKVAAIILGTLFPQVDCEVAGRIEGKSARIGAEMARDWRFERLRLHGSRLLIVQLHKLKKCRLCKKRTAAQREPRSSLNNSHLRARPRRRS